MTFFFIVSGILIHRTSRRCHRKIQRSCRSQVGQGSQSLVCPAPTKRLSKAERGTEDESRSEIGNQFP